MSPGKEITLSSAQRRAITHRGSPLQIIACAGSGKTETVSRRAAAIIQEGAAPASIVAFTFTERAATELKDRIYRRVAETMGQDFLGKLGPMFVGTIHGFCFKMLQDCVPQFGNYDMLNEDRHAAFVSREFYSIGLEKLERQRHWETVGEFIHTTDVIANELIPDEKLPKDGIGLNYRRYVELLHRYRFLTFGLSIVHAVEALQQSAVRRRVVAPLRHLIVDEYQDINPAQEALIRRLSPTGVELCVVGDDDQSIYQWRGSEVKNILTFKKRKPDVRTVDLLDNHRSRPDIIKTANTFAASIPGRLKKKMLPKRAAGKNEVVLWTAETPADEAELIADGIEALRKKGYRLRDIAVLFLSVRTSASPLLDILDARNIPFNCAGRSGLFLHRDIATIGEIFAWFVGEKWKTERFQQPQEASLDDIATGLCEEFRLGKSQVKPLKKYLEDWRTFRTTRPQPVSLVGDFYQLLHRLGVHTMDLEQRDNHLRFGRLARFSTILADFEHATRRRETAGGIDGVGANIVDRGIKMYERLHRYLMHYAIESYEDFIPDSGPDEDAVDILTAHRAKGLEWPIVFVPSMKAGRWPSSRSGREQEWLLDDRVLSPAKKRRYEGGDAEERRLFYVAITRARDAVYVSTFEHMQKAARPSIYFEELAEMHDMLESPRSLPLPATPPPTRTDEKPAIEISFSEIADYQDCGYRYCLQSVLGFEQELAVELGYGKAIHHVLRHVAEYTREKGKPPTWKQAEHIIDEEFYLPFANPEAHKRMRRSAEDMVRRYLDDYSADLMRIWEVERSFELPLDGGTVTGRADVILDREKGRPDNLAVVDYKSASDQVQNARFEQQLAVYASAGRGEGLSVEAAYLHDLKKGRRLPVDVAEDVCSDVCETVSQAVHGIRAGRFIPNAKRELCERCDCSRICRHAAAES